MTFAHVFISLLGLYASARYSKPIMLYEDKNVMIVS